MGPKAKALLLAVFSLLLLARLWIAGGQPAAPGPRDPARLLDGARQRVEISLEGTLLQDPRPGGAPERCRVLLELTPGRLQGRVELQLNPCPVLQQGWQIRASGVLSRPQPAPHPLLAGPAERLARQGAWSQLRVGQLQVLARPPTPVATLRRTIAQRLQQQAGPRNGSVLAALVLGSAVVPLPAEVRESFRAAGLSHALAASGFHLSVLLGAVLLVGRRLPRLPRLLLAGGAMLLFLLLAGPQPSVLRAVGMGALALLLLEAGQRGRPLLVLLAVAAGLLLWRPDWLWDVGFQLSVAATAGLILTARPLDAALAQRLPRWLAAAVAVPLSAFVWTLPLQLLHFGVVPLYAIPANLLAAPLLTPLTLGAMALAVVALLLPPALPLLAWPLALLSSLLIGLTRWVAALPMAQWQLGRPQPWLVLLLAAASLALALPRVRARWRWLALAAVVLVVAVHLALLRGDQLLLVHQGRGDQGRDLLLARHQGRAALVSTAADGYSCSQATRLAQGLGVQRLDWALLLDPLAPEDPACWNKLAGLVLASADGSPPLLPGQRLRSPGLAAAPVAIDARALSLQVGSQRWLLLPDRQSLWAWREAEPAAAAEGIWLGFRPTAGERRQLDHAAADQGHKPLWFSGVQARRPWPPWASTGASGSLVWDGRRSHRLGPGGVGGVDP
ncbi:MAG: ComEC/Rec2 family competence protein [Cyanobacteriota bacterium]|nr:ComEC/Rec2 family competence protein [Cyanobacteriota bacterium]